MGISRRNFIKGTAGAVALGAFGTMVSTDKWLLPVAAAGEIEERVAYTYHQTQCMGGCCLKCTVRNGKLVKIEPNTMPDKTPSPICLKGLSEIQRVYSPERIRTPLKRVGKRGEGKFVAISWDEALNTIAEKITSIKSQYGGKSIIYHQSAAPTFQFLPRLLGIQHNWGSGIDFGFANGLEPALGGLPYALGTNEINDWVNSKTILNLGCNILETGMAQAKWLFLAQEAGAKVITVDPYHSTTASHSNRWIPIEPGTDAALLLGMITEILENKWYDAAFLSKNTSAPFLIRSDNQALLRQNDSADGPDKNPYMVWDELTKSLKPYNAPGIQPQLEGEFTANGIKVKTVFAAIKEHHQQYTTAWAAKITEIPEQDIKELAEIYATGGPAVLAFGWGGADKWANSDIAGHAVAILTALTGNIGRVGGGTGVFLNRGLTATMFMAALTPWPLPAEFKAIPLQEFPAVMTQKEETPIKAYINVGDTFIQLYPNMNQTIKWLEKLDFIVTVEIFNNTSVAYSDIVLPSCTRFETEDDIGLMITDKGSIKLQQKVLNPLFESKSDFQIEREIAAKFGLDQYLPKNLEELQRNALKSQMPGLAGITLEALVKNNGVMELPLPKEPYRMCMDQVYPTPSTKMELYYENMIEFQQALPTWEEPSEATESNPLFQKYPLQLSQQRTKYRIHSNFYNATWLNQYTGSPKLFMNPADGEKRNLTKGDLVEIFNDRGSVVCHYEPDNGVRPGHPRVYEAAWSSYMKKGHFQQLTNDKFPARAAKLKNGPTHPLNDTLVEVRKYKEED